MCSALLRVPKPLSFAPVHALKFLAILFLGFVCAEYCVAQQLAKKPPAQEFWIVFDAMAQRGPCYPHDVYVMDQKGEHVKRLTSDHRSHNPSWSPDGRGIVFLEDECKPPALFPYGSFDELRDFLSTPRDVYWMNSDGRNSSLIARIGPNAQDTLWIPIGNQVAVRLADRSSLVVHMKGSRFPSNGQPEEPLSRYLEVEGDWYRKLYCQTSESALGTTYPIEVYCPGGGRLLILTPPADNFLPTFYGSHGLSNLGRWALADKLQYSADLSTSLSVMSLNGGAATAPVPAYDSAWSRDGRRIAYSSFTGDQNSILYVADLHAEEAGKPRALTDQELDAHGPDWSADGSRIGFTGLWRDSSQIFIIKADGSNLIQLSRDANMRCSHVSWSPDGRWIAAACSPNVTIANGEGLVPGNRSNIYLFDSSRPGAKPRRLTECGHNARYDLCGARNPSFAPAGP